LNPLAVQKSRHFSLVMASSANLAPVSVRSKPSLARRASGEHPTKAKPLDTRFVYGRGPLVAVAVGMLVVDVTVDVVKVEERELVVVVVWLLLVLEPLELLVEVVPAVGTEVMATPP